MMARQMKRWESPRREGRNDKGRGGSARKRQKRKQFQALRQKLKNQATDPNKPDSQTNHDSRKGGKIVSLLFLLTQRRNEIKSSGGNQSGISNAA